MSSVKSPADADIVVVGAGPAGLAAAATAAQAGASVVVIERLPWPGGRLGLQTQPLQGPRSIYQGLSGVEFCRRLLDEAASAGVEVRLETDVSRLQSDSCSASPFLIETASPSAFLVETARTHNSARTLRARALVLATGSSEPWCDFPGSELPGVMLSGDAQTLLTVHGRLPGKRVLMVGSDNAGLLIAANLLDAGATVVAVVDESPAVVGREVNAAPLREAGVEIHPSHRLVRAIGDERVEAAVVAQVDAAGEIVPGSERTLRVDTVCLAGPRVPEARLAEMAGCPLLPSEVLGGPVPQHGRRMAAPVPGLFVCGDVAGVENGAVSLESGRLAGLHAALELALRHPEAEAIERLARARLGYLRRGRRGALRREAKRRLDAECGRARREKAC